jgi:hypothetical protein
MDNFFDILIFLIIIISIVSSFLKKKQLPKQTSERRTQPLGPKQVDPQVSTEQPKEAYDILNEIEDFFKVGSEPAGPEKTKEETEEPQSIIQKDERAKSESWHSPTASEHSYTDDWERKKEELKKKILRVDSGVEKQAAKFEESLHRKETEPSQLALIVKSRLGNPASLKEYIIFSEILGKPKALRR